jgi:hypothetical protein
MQMSFRRVATIAAFCALLSGCSSPVPPDRADYVGEWRERNMSLVITQDGQVSYKAQMERRSNLGRRAAQGFEGTTSTSASGR